MTARCRKRFFALMCLPAIWLTAGCYEQINMDKQPHARPLEPSPFFADGASARPMVEGVVSTDGYRFTSAPEQTPPRQPEMTRELLARGREVFNTSCMPCHGQGGYGDGMVVRRGYPQPPSYHDERLRNIPDEYLYRVITHGLGKMPALADQVPEPRDRWALVSYIRALQLSQNAAAGDVPEADLTALSRPAAATAPADTTATRENSSNEEEQP